MFIDFIVKFSTTSLNVGATSFIQKKKVTDNVWRIVHNVVLGSRNTNGFEVEYVHSAPVKEGDFWEVSDRSKFTGYLGWVLGKFFLKILRPLFFCRKNAHCPLFFPRKISPFNFFLKKFSPPPFFSKSLFPLSVVPTNFDLSLKNKDKKVKKN